MVLISNQLYYKRFKEKWLLCGNDKKKWDLADILLSLGGKQRARNPETIRESHRKRGRPTGRETEKRETYTKFY